MSLQETASSYQAETKVHLDREICLTPSGIKLKEAWGNEKKTEPEQEKTPTGDEWTPSWKEFTQKTSFHGIKYIFEGGSIVRRFFWLVLVLTAVSFFVSQVSLRIIEYYKYQTVISVKRILVDELDFPAVTLCNLNQFRQDYALELWISTKEINCTFYFYINNYFDAHCWKQIYENNATSQDICEKEATHINLTDITESLGHQKNQLIDNCWWKGQECDMNYDFTMRYTDIGLCFTFNFHPDNPKTVNETGPDGGLQLLLNVENYEHMRGEHLDAGVKLLLHNPQDRPSLKGVGFIAKPGDHSFVTISHSKVENLPHPYGDCLEDIEPIEHCKRKCYEAEYIRVCGCYDTYMDGNGGKPLCNLTQKYDCPCNKKRSMGGSSCQSACSKSCQASCKSENFKPTLSSSQLSKINLDTFVLTGDGEKEYTEKTFILGKETQLRKSLEWPSLISAASNTMSAFDSIYNITQKYNFGESNSPYKYLPAFATYIDDDMNDIFYHKTLALERKGIVCITDWMQEGVFDMAALLMMVVDAAYTAIKLDKAGCGKSSEWTDNVVEICDGEYGSPTDIMNDCLYDADMRRPLQLDSCGGEEKVVCGCKIAAFLDTEIPSGLQYLEDIKATYKENLKQFTGIDELNATKFDDVGDHATCLSRIEELQNIVPGLLHSIVNSTESLRTHRMNTTFVDFVQEFYRSVPYPIPGIFKINEKLSWSKGDRGIFNPCCWPQTYSFEMVESKYGTYPMNDIANDQYLDAQEYSKDIDTSQLVTNVNLIHDDGLLESLQDIQKHIDHISQLIKGNMTLYQVAIFYDDTVIKKLQNVVIVTGEAFADRLDKIRMLLQGILKNLNEYIDIIHNQMMIQLLTDDKIGSAKIRKFVQQQFENLNEYISADCHGESFDSLSDDIYMVMFIKFVCTTKHNVEEDVTQTQSLLQTFDSEFSSLVTMLDTFRVSTRMDGDFYGDNFMQVDLYYDQLQYENIEEQPSFVLGSLFSEVGGFLGLLLGASVMTVCELIDYLILIWGKRQGN